MAATLQESYTFDTFGSENNVGIGTWKAQVFTATVAFRITSVKLRLHKKAGESPGTLILGIQALSGGVPDGTDLVTGTTDGDTLPNRAPPYNPEERTFTFSSPPELQAGVQYAAVLRAPSADSTASAYWPFFADGYAGGLGWTSTDSGATWSSGIASDNWFEVWGETYVFTPPAARPTKKRLIALAKDRFYYEDV